MKLRIIAPNQTVLTLDNGIEVFFSYNTPVAANLPDKLPIITQKKWSKTTSGHINYFLHGREYNTMPQEFFDNLIK